MKVSYLFKKPNGKLIRLPRFVNVESYIDRGWVLEEEEELVDLFKSTKVEDEEDKNDDVDCGCH